MTVDIWPQGVRMADAPPLPTRRAFLQVSQVCGSSYCDHPWFWPELKAESWGSQNATAYSPPHLFARRARGGALRGAKGKTVLELGEPAPAPPLAPPRKDGEGNSAVLVADA